LIGSISPSSDVALALFPPIIGKIMPMLTKVDKSTDVPL
jgi:hypothetical protein